jgi:hypothetical protein
MNLNIANLLVPFCEASSVSSRDCGNTLKKRIIVSLPFVDSVALHDQLFPGQHLDWIGAKEYLQEATYTTSDWISLVSLIDFINEQPPKQQNLELISSALAGMKISTQGKSMTPLESLQLCFAKAGISPSWDMLCKALVLCNLTDVDHFQVLQHLLSSTPAVGNTTVADLVRFLPTSCRHTPQEYTSAFYSIMSSEGCQVRTHAIMQSLRSRDEALEKHKLNAMAVFSNTRKPSISRILEEKSHQNSDRKNQDSFQNFSEASRMASNASSRVKRIVYYVMCMPHNVQFTNNLTCDSILSTLVGADPVVLSSLANMTIVSPDIHAIKTFISETQHTGAPCQALRLFRQTCIPGTSRGVHWTTILRLYLTAYSRPNICKDLWGYTLSIASSDFSSNGDNSSITLSGNNSSGLHFSTETDSAVQAFVRQHPMCMQDILSILTEI